MHGLLPNGQDGAALGAVDGVGRAGGVDEEGADGMLAVVVDLGVLEIRVEAGSLHFVETRGGRILICANSLPCTKESVSGFTHLDLSRYE